MLSKKPLILILAIAFSVHCSNGHAKENRLPLRFALAIVKALIKTPPTRIRLLPQPDTRYCCSPDPGVEAKVSSRAASDEGSGSVDSGISDENSNNGSNEDETDTVTDVQYVTTTPNPFPVSNEISEYCAILVLKKIKQEPVSDSEMPAESEGDTTEVDFANDLKITLPAYSTDHLRHLKTHKQPSLPANQRPKMYQCDHKGCNHSSDRKGDLKKHRQTHLPANQRPKIPKVHQCDHKGCNYRTGRMGDLNMHRQTHLPADQRPKKPKVQCDHEGCNYSTVNTSNLKRHKRTHLPADPRPRVQCDHEGCNYSTVNASNLKRHKQIHLPADQRRKRAKRKAYAQPPSNEKRKKVDKE
ncbi:C2H2-type zinc finger protein [Endozoicomonas sp. 4G]|uniref:C2H2-type zinc finger protein n=1 Tax=Endozoicomonas sp. 4G TaxID=2872754 RepID=UPI0020785659|nr:C2H2-type zinc finger protein [Endozoicomonas sp. 4G]